jgi:dienelactone hydrolase
MEAMRIHIIRRLILFAIFFVTGSLTFSRAQPVGTDVAGQNFAGDFYCEPSAIPRPGILLLGGSEGGRPIKHWPMLLAQNGYAVLAVAYFKEKGSPNTLEMIPLEYFDIPIAWLL